VPPSEQKAIADHIRRELKGTETAITRTEREISLIREYRMTLTAEVVTGKLDVREAAQCLVSWRSAELDGQSIRRRPTRGR
jgi:type I restriction enzyme S subunit